MNLIIKSSRDAPDIIINIFCLDTLLGAGSSDGSTYVHARKRADYLNSAHHKRPKQARLLGHGSGEANRQLDQNSNHLWLQREGNAVYHLTPVA